MCLQTSTNIPAGRLFNRWPWKIVFGFQANSMLARNACGVGSNLPRLVAKLRCGLNPPSAVI
jgi:hypothetical protein